MTNRTHRRCTVCWTGAENLLAKVRLAMSVQFGRLKFDGKPAEQDYLEKIQPLLLPYGPDDQGLYSDGAISMLYCAFQTTKESRREKQPLVIASGSIITWDGRLDNRAEL